MERVSKNNNLLPIVVKLYSSNWSSGKMSLKASKNEE